MVLSVDVLRVRLHGLALRYSHIVMGISLTNCDSTSLCHRRSFSVLFRQVYAVMLLNLANSHLICLHLVWILLNAIVVASNQRIINTYILTNIAYVADACFMSTET